MKKKIQIGIIIAVAILLLIPSIPAIQTNVVKEESKEEVVKEKLEEIIELFKSGKLDKIKHPLLYLLFIATLFSRYIKIYVLVQLSGFKSSPYGFFYDRPILGLRTFILLVTTFLWEGYWLDYSDNHGWNWKSPFW